MKYPLITELKLKEGIPVMFSCRVLNLCRRAYYDWLKEPKGLREREEEIILGLLKEAHQKDPAAGYRVLADDVEGGLAKKGIHAGDERIWRICSKNRIWANHSNPHAKTRRGRSLPPAHDDLVQRDFTAAKPNKVWLSDITEHPTNEGKVYWCGFKDLHSNLIVGQAMGNRMTANLVESALLSGLKARGYPKDVIVHSDRGGQYTSELIQSAIKKHGLRGSMGQVHTCADNAAMESFNALLQKNVFNQKRQWQTRAELKLAIFKWINVRYHKQRRQKALKDMTPQEYDLIYG